MLYIVISSVGYGKMLIKQKKEAIPKAISSEKFQCRRILMSAIFKMTFKWFNSKGSDGVYLSMMFMARGVC